MAMSGTTRAYYLPLMRPYMIQAANAFAVAAREAKLEFVVQMSQWSSCASHPTAMTRQTWLIDRMFSMIPGVAHTIFNPGMFADNFLRTMDFSALLGDLPYVDGRKSKRSHFERRHGALRCRDPDGRPRNARGS